MQLSDWLRTHNLSDKDFADRSDGQFSEEAVRKWRFRARRPRLAQLATISDLTGGAVTANDFFARPAPAQQGSAAA